MLTQDEALASYGEIIDRYMALKHPDAAAHCKAAAQAAFKSFDGIDWKKAASALEERKRQYYASFIPEDAPFSIDDVMAGKQYRNTLKSTGKHRDDHQYRNLDIALQAFLRIENQGGETKEAVAEAISDLAKEKHGSGEKTIRGWLAAILPFSSLKQTSRGRPKNR